MENGGKEVSCLKYEVLLKKLRIQQKLRIQPSNISKDTGIYNHQQLSILT